MPIDLNRFIATFFDEAQEHLESIEERAMALGAAGGDTETLNAIFRAAHSIKGGSGTFGFTQLSEATHEMETLFDQLRKGQRLADASTVRLVLDACDVFKSHLARLKAGQRDSDPAMETLRERLKTNSMGIMRIAMTACWSSRVLRSSVATLCARRSSAFAPWVATDCCTIA